MKSLKQLFDDKKAGETSSPDPSPETGEGRRKGRFISREYQDFGYRLAMDLGDEKHKALYIKLAKEVDRAILEKCRSFVIDSNADNKGALFMWKMKELKDKKK
jgi:hypothetical protein